MKIILIFTTLLLIDICAFSQIRNIVKTPKGQDVTDSWAIPELLSYQDKLDISDSVALLYPLATEVNAPSATSTYNCHGYAWHIIENGSPIVWIGWNPGITGEDIYWTDGSYIEVSSLDYAQKISYEGDHSAIKLNGNTCRSKWGAWSLVDHPVDYGPDIYKMSQRKYYKLSPPVISGNFSAICDASHRTFSESTFTDIDLNYDWNCTGPLSEVDGDGTPQYTVERTFLDGTGTVSLTVTTPSGATAATSKNIWVGAPVAPTEIIPFWNNGMEFGNDSYYDFRVIPHLSASYYNWDVDGGTITEGQGTYWITVKTQKITGNFNVNFSVGVRAGSLGCGESSRFVRTGWVIPGTGGATLAFTPNPATGETTLSIETTSEDSEFDENAEWELEVYSPAQLLKEKKNNLRGKSAKIQTSGWTEGIYMVRVKYKDEVLQGKLVVKR